MSDAALDTTVPPVEPGQEPVAPAAEPVVTEPVVQEPTPSEPPLEDRIMQKFQSWQGRRDAQLREEFQGQLNQVLQAVQARTAPQEEVDTTTQFLNDPTGFLDKYVDQKWSQKAAAETQKTQAFIQSAARIMDSDPDFADQKLGFEVIEKLKGIQVDPNLPPNVSADLAVTKAKAQVLAEKVRTKTNPLSGNKPVTAHIGTVTPGAAPSPTAPKVEISDEIRAYGKKIGLTDKEIEEEFLKG